MDGFAAGPARSELAQVLPRATFEAAGAATPQPYLGLTAIGPASSERTNREHALVLQSMSIWHTARRSEFAWFLLVRDEDAARAQQSIDRYQQENRNWPPPRRRERPRYKASPAALLVAVALAIFFGVTGPAISNSHFFQAGGAEAQLLLFHEPWRAVTALTLHNDAEHILANAVSGTIFVTLVNRRLGAGIGTLAVLLSGIAGNALNAAWHLSSHDGGYRSIGASTAIFGAVGILAATQMALDSRASDGGAKRSLVDLVAPVIGGLALLGALGAGGDHPGQTDLGAHLYGLLSGFVIGMTAAGIAIWNARRTPHYAIQLGQRVAEQQVTLGGSGQSVVAQAIAGSLAVVVVMVSWAMALTY